jgi:hypothetical protein
VEEAVVAVEAPAPEAEAAVEPVVEAAEVAEPEVAASGERQ